MRIFNRYPVRVIIYEKRGNSLQKLRDKGVRIQKGTGEVFYKIKKKKLKTPPISYEHIYMVNYDGKLKETVYLYSTTPYTFTPIKLNEEFAAALESGTLSIMEIEDKLMPPLIKANNPPGYNITLKASDKWLYWATHQLKQNVYRAQYKTTLEKILPIAMVATTGMVIGIMLYMSIGQMQIISDGFTSASNSMIQVSQNLESVARILANQPAPTPPPF